MSFITRSRLTNLGHTLFLNQHYMIPSDSLYSLDRRGEEVPVYYYGDIIGFARMAGKKLNVVIDRMGPKMTYQFKRSCVSGLFCGDTDEVFGQGVPV